MRTFLKTLLGKKSPKAVASPPRSIISREALNLMAFPEVAELLMSLGPTPTYSEVSSLERRLYAIAVYDNHVPEEQRKAALQLSKALTEDFKKVFSGNEDAMAAHKVLLDIRIRNDRLMGYGSLAWQLAEYSISGADVIPYVMKPENRGLVEDFFTTVSPDALAVAKSECVRQLVLQSPYNTKNAVLILHGLVAKGDPAALAVFSRDELRVLLDVPNDYDSGRNILVNLKLLPAVSTARPFNETPELHGVVALMLQEWMARSEADSGEIAEGENKYSFLICLTLLRIELAQAQIRQSYGHEIALNLDEMFKSPTAAQAVREFRQNNQALLRATTTPGASIDLALLDVVMTMGVAPKIEESSSDRQFREWAAQQLNSERVKFLGYFRFLLRFLSDRAVSTRNSADETITALKNVGSSQPPPSANDAVNAAYWEDEILPHDSARYGGGGQKTAIRI